MTRWTRSLLLYVVFTACSRELVTKAHNSNAMYSDRYVQCQLETEVAELATPQTERFLTRSFAGTRMQMPYRLFVPPTYDATVETCLVLWLHGGAGWGTDNESQITTNANLIGTHSFIADEIQQENPCFVLAPQIPDDQTWAIPDKHTLSESLLTVLELLDAIEGEFAVDTRRMYALGHSLGGAGTWDLLSKGPGRFAAYVPMAAISQWSFLTYDADFADSIKKRNFWFLYGETEAEGLLQPWWEDVVRSLRRDGVDPYYTEYLGGGHGISRCAFTEPDLLPWLFSNTL